jgi:hypothetical protein
MSETTISCGLVEEGDLDTRYLAGTLGEAEAEAFEAHYFGCDRCWALVQQGLDARAAFSGGGIPRRRPMPVRRWWLAAAAAAVVVAGAGLYRSLGRGKPFDDTVTRGTAAKLVLSTAIRADTLLAVWNRIPDATEYRARLYTAAGDLTWERKTADTALAVTPDSLPSHPDYAGLSWEVHAINAVGSVLGSSGLVAAIHTP